MATLRGICLNYLDGFLNFILISHVANLEGSVYKSAWRHAKTAIVSDFVICIICSQLKSNDLRACISFIVK